MKLSIIIPYYNADKWIGDCLDSLLNQDLEKDEYEIVVIDDGSTEKKDCLLEYVDKYDNIRYYYQDHAFPGAARNHGISESRGEYIFFCDADDFVQANVFGKLIEIADRLHLEALYFNVSNVSRGESIVQIKSNFDKISSIVTGKEYLTAPSRPIMFGPVQFLISRHTMEKLSLAFPEKMLMAEDRIFTLNMLMKLNRVAYVDVDVYYYVHNQDSVVHYSGKKLKAGLYANGLFIFIKKLSEEINDTSNPEIIKRVLKQWRSDDVFSLLYSVFRYCPVSLTKDYIKKLKEISAYPFQFRNLKNKLTRFIERWMNHERIWILCCIIFHILPLKVRYRF